jgi:hypothetical protein
MTSGSCISIRIPFNGKAKESFSKAYVRVFIHWLEARGLEG